jgi:hypothetical protein
MRSSGYLKEERVLHFRLRQATGISRHFPNCGFNPHNFIVNEFRERIPVLISPCSGESA